MAGSFLLDTNIAIALMKSDPSVLSQLASAEATFLCSIVAGELSFGAYKSGRVTANLAAIEQLAAASGWVEIDAATARVYGSVKAQLRVQGTPLPENDIWVAATAIRHGLIVASRDHHFDSIAGLQLEVW